jgi:hypothetical protein
MFLLEISEVSQTFCIIFYNVLQCLKWSVVHHSFVLTVKCLAIFLCKHTHSDCLLNPASVLHKIYFSRAISPMHIDLVSAVSETVSISIIRYLCCDEDGDRLRHLIKSIISANRLRIFHCMKSPWKLQILCTVLHIYMPIWKAKNA